MTTTETTGSKTGTIVAYGLVAVALICAGGGLGIGFENVRHWLAGWL